MKFILVFSVILGYVTCQIIHGHELRVLIDSAFAAIDKDHSGTMTTIEHEAFLKAMDTNGDGSISCDEYVAHSTAPRALALEMFKQIEGTDHNCLMTYQEAMAATAHMDQNGDGVVSLHEFEHVYTEILKHLGHLPNGGK